MLKGHSKTYRVAILSEPIDNQDAGIHVYLSRLIKALPKDSEINYELIRMKDPKDDYGLRNRVVKAVAIPAYLLFRKFVQLPFFFRKERYDAVVEPAHFGPFFLKKSTSRVCIIHDLTPVLFPKFHPRHSVVLHKLLLRRIIKKSDLIIVNSDNTRRDILEFHPNAASKTKRVYPSVSEIFKPDSQKEKLRAYGIKKDYFLSVGTFEPRKDHITIVKAFEGFKNNCPESPHELVLVGRKGWKSEDLYAYVKKSSHAGSIRILHNVETKDLPVLYSNCLAFIYASVYEGFGFPLLEANNCGAVCFAADNSSLSEIGKPFAYYFETRNADELGRLMTDRHLSPQRFQAGTPEYYNSFGIEFDKQLLNLLEK